MDNGTKEFKTKAEHIKAFKDAGFDDNQAEFFYQLDQTNSLEEGLKKGSELKKQKRFQ